MDILPNGQYDTSARKLSAKAVIINKTNHVTVDPQSLPRITPELTLPQLKDECRARRIKQGSNKLDLLTSLQIGSVHLSALREFGFLESVKQIMEEENSSRLKEFQNNLRQYRDQKAAKEHEKIDKGNEKRIKMKTGREEEKKTQLVLHITRCEDHLSCLVADTAALKLNGKPRVSNSVCSCCGYNRSKEILFTCEKCDWDICKRCFDRNREVSSQQAKHNRRCVCHPCFVGETSALLFDGKSRELSASCRLCGSTTCKLSCLKCRWDICNQCIAWGLQELQLPKQRQAETAANKAKHTISHNFHDCLLAKTSDLRSNGKRRASDALLNCSCSWKGCTDTRATRVVLSCQDCNFDICAACVAIATKLNKKRKRNDDVIEAAPEVFDNTIKNPPTANLNKASLKAFVVWTCCAYSYNQDPVFEFDSSFDTADEANSRARFVMYYDNAWGLSKEDLERDGVVEETRVDDLVTFVVHPPDSERFTVAAVKKKMFEDLRGPDNGNELLDRSPRGRVERLVVTNLWGRR